jgi:hypothetical protein
VLSASGIVSVVIRVTTRGHGLIFTVHVPVSILITITMAFSVSISGLHLRETTTRQTADHVSGGEAATTGGVVLAALGAQEAAAEDQTNGEGTTANNTANQCTPILADDCSVKIIICSDDSSLRLGPEIVSRNELIN